MYWILPCTYMQEHTGSARACSHTTVYARRRVCTRAHICTHRGTSVQRTPSILNPDPGLLSVFTCKWSTTICGPSRLLRPSSRLGPGMRAASQMGVCGGGGGPHQMGSHGHGAKRSEREGREGGKRLPAWQPLKQQGLPHIMEVVHGSVPDWRAVGRDAKARAKGLSPARGPRPTQARLSATCDAACSHARWDGRWLGTWSPPCG